MITDELREWARDNTVQGEVFTTYPVQHPVHGTLESLVAIADRIDTTYEEDVNTACKLANSLSADELANRGWIRAPLDADGVLIFDGDKMVSPHGNVFIVTHMMLENGTWTVHGWKPLLLHHHKSSVEDVLTEFSCVLMGKREFDGDVTDAIAEYATKLCLKEDE